MSVFNDDQSIVCREILLIEVNWGENTQWEGVVRCCKECYEKVKKNHLETDILMLLLLPLYRT